MRIVGDRQVRNDHTDAAYDKSVLEGFDPIHRDICDLIGTIATSAPRIGSYQQRLDQALGKIRSGDLRYIAAPDRDSYHTAWFELHQDLIGLAGTTRQKEAAAGRALVGTTFHPARTNGSTGFLMEIFSNLVAGRWLRPLANGRRPLADRRRGRA